MQFHNLRNAVTRSYSLLRITNGFSSFLTLEDGAFLNFILPQLYGLTLKLLFYGAIIYSLPWCPTDWNESILLCSSIPGRSHNNAVYLAVRRVLVQNQVRGYNLFLLLVYWILPTNGVKQLLFITTSIILGSCRSQAKCIFVFWL